MRPKSSDTSLATGARRRWAAIVFAALVVPLGAILVFATPNGGVADEIAHSLRAESLAGGEIAGYRGMSPLSDGSAMASAGVTANIGIADATMLNIQTRQSAPADISRAKAAQWRPTRDYAEITPLALYLPIFYAPAALAIHAAETLGQSPFAAFRAARLANLFVYAAMGLAALLLARRGQAIFLCTLAVPMEVSLAASINQDGLLVATAVLGVALLTRDIDAPDAVGDAGGGPKSGAPWRPTPSWLAAAGLLGCVALAKIPYLGLLALLLFPIRPFGRGLATRAGLACVVALPALAWTVYAMRAIATPWPPLPPYAPGPLWSGPRGAMFHSPNAAAQMRVLIAKPVRIVRLTWGTITGSDTLAFEAVGVLGFLNISLPDAFYPLWFCAAGAAVAADALGGDAPAAGARWRPLDAAVAALAVAGCVVAIYMSQYLNWTLVGHASVDGPSGRYFLPLLPAIVFMLPAFRSPWGGWVWPALALPLAVAAAIGIIVVPFTVIEAFYVG